MPLTLVSAPASRPLWTAFLDRALRERTHVWLSHRNHRDLLFESAHQRGSRGWLDPPITFLSDLPERFAVRTRPAGLLTRRRLLARAAASHGARLDVGEGSARHGIARSHMLDPLLGEILAGGVEAQALRRALAEVADDDFAKRRNAWVTAVHRDYVDALASRGLHDPRQVPALVAAAVAAGGLGGALGAARALHVWGMHAMGTWGTLVRALAAQHDVAATLYLVDEEESDPEWDTLGARRERMEAPPRREPIRVQPAPDATRELLWVATQVKSLLASGACEPWEVAVVARSGGDDTRRAWRTLDEAGVPATARVRTPLHEIAALKALLEVLHGAAGGWPYRTLRNVLGSPYLDVRVDLRFLDRAARRRRIEGLDAWSMELGKEGQRLAALAEERDSEGLATLARHARVAGEAFERFRKAVAPLAAPGDETAWIDRTLALVATEDVFHFRERISRPVGERFDVVRLDQRGVLQLAALLHEWRGLDLDGHVLSAAQWHALLRRLLEGHQLALTTPLQKGVQVLDALDAALTPFLHVFVVHANDGVFPRQPAGRGVLSEAERARLAERGLLPVADRARALRRERTLWRAVTAAPSLTVTYRTTDPAGTPMLPSLMVPPHPAGIELRRDWEPDAPLDPLAHHRALADRLARRDDVAPVATPDPGLLRTAIVAAHAEDARAALEATSAPSALPLTPWAGWVREPGVLALLSERYGAEHVWSASQLESYASCPWLFFTERVLRLEDVGEAEEETDPRTFGGVAHRLLERFWSRVKDAPPQHLDAAAEAEYEAARQQVLAALEDEDRWMGLPLLWRETWLEVSDAVRAYIRWELPALAASGRRPHLVEFGFGRDALDPVLLSGADHWGAKRELLLAGRIDRVDRLPEDGRAIVDYKSSTVPTAKSYLDGVTLQSALYMAALHEQQGFEVKRAGYRSIKKPGKGTRLDITWGDDAFATALSMAFSVPARVRAGRFEPVQAASAQWQSWHPKRDVCRTRGALRTGTRWDEEA